jgi:predicted nucleotidyltransferase
MGRTRKSTPVRADVASALFSKVQQRVLALLFGQPDRRFQSAELIRLAAGGTGAAHRCVAALVKADLVTAIPIGNQRHYQANRASPVFEDLRGLIEKTVGLADLIRDALAPLRARIFSAFVYGSVAKRAERAGSDVDLLVISDDIEYAELYSALPVAERRLGRKVEPTIVSPADWARKSSLGDSFTSRVRSGRRVVIFGSSDA